MSIENTKSDPENKKKSRLWIFDLILISVLLLAAYFRLTGLFWGENQFLHPDERFLVWVGTDISPVSSLSEYFDTANSSLNPHNRGHGFYVYGTLPMFLARYIVEWIYGHSGFKEMTEVGRSLSAIADILTVVLVYLIAKRVYDKRVALIAALFSTAAVAQIQHSHFFTMDTFLVFFSFLAFYFAIRIVTDDKDWERGATEQSNDIKPDPSQQENNIDQPPGRKTRNPFHVFQIIHHPLLLPCLGFGIALGMAVASKLNAAPMALILPGALAFRLLELPPNKRERYLVQSILFLGLAALVSLVTFRLLQPYAFSGPDFLGIKPNPQWLANIQELRAQSSGDVDFPPAMQWARRPVWFSGKNLVLWGLGLPLGILAWFGFLWAGWQMLTCKDKKRSTLGRHALLWGWTAVYFTWQSLSQNPSMRYQLLVYPTLAIFAAWAIVEFYDKWKSRRNHVDQEDEGTDSTQANAINRDSNPLLRLLVILAATIVLISTIAYAFAFTQIYDRPITRIEASRWIYQNIPAAINLRIQTTEGITNQPLPFPYTFTITPGTPYVYNFQPKVEGELYEIYLPNVSDQLGGSEEKNLEITISSVASPEDSITSASVSDVFPTADASDNTGYTITFDQPITLDTENTYILSIKIPGEVSGIPLTGEITLRIQPFEGSSSGEAIDQVLSGTSMNLRHQAPFALDFSTDANGHLEQILIESAPLEVGFSVPQNIKLKLALLGSELEMLESDMTIQENSSDQGYWYSVNQPPALLKGQDYVLTLETEPTGLALSLTGKALANEGDWDDGLPLRLDGYDGFGGLYPLDLNFNMYWDDNPEKLERFLRILDESDFILISSSRQWGSLPRIPERYPMTTIYYRNLLGCPTSEEIERCYNLAEPGMFQGNLGFELTQVFRSDPVIGPLRINDQFAEEAFTVYDHPKVFVFQKTDAYDSEQVRRILSTTDFTQTIRTPPMRMPSYPANLLLPDERLAEQRIGGTWSELFDTSAPHNRYQVLSVVVWYLSVSLLGLATYPVLRIALPGLEDKGYPLARTAGLLILSYFVWLASSFRIPFSRMTISAVLAIILLIGAFLAYQGRYQLRREIQNRGRYFLIIEVLSLGFFITFLLVRLGNPDLWHPWKGGEKPMDFSYFNAILKSTSFPPYDPWYAGGYLNYYYYGFVLVGVLVKWLGIVPAVAYNLILPTLFSLIAMGAFSLVWNLYTARFGNGTNNLHEKITNEDTTQSQHLLSGIAFKPSAYWIGLAGALGMAVLGNLGTVRMIFQGYQKLAAPDGVLEVANLLTRWVWAIRGFAKTLQGASLPYGIGDWYWIPSRAIPSPGDIEPITEFPYFTVLYGDLHAHLVALPIALFALSVILAFVLGRGHWKSLLGGLIAFLLAGLSIGALRPTNTADFYPYLSLGIVALGYTYGFNFQMNPRTLSTFPFLRHIPEIGRRFIYALAATLLLIGLSYILYQPYTRWSAFGYGELDLWKGTHTPTSAFITHWGLFLFVIFSWMVWETRDWMVSTPMSSLRKLVPYRFVMIAIILFLLVGIVASAYLKVRIAWLVIPTAAWAGALIIRPKQPDAKRFVLFLIGTGLIMTLMVEFIVVVGDIGRMNTVFKFYLQVWTFFAISAAAGLGWVLAGMAGWSPSWRTSWSVILILLVAGTALYPLTASMAKIKDRMAPKAPHSLDGMAYMEFANYGDVWGVMDLSQDYRAIQWLQENVVGSPVIVEANLRALYRWGSRYSIYTGLPGVVGWEWHQQQQRTAVPNTWVSDRIAEIDAFYSTIDWEAAKDFLRKYDIRYIILGQQERGHYPGPGLEKFEDANGIIWREVYRDGDTVIYEVFPQ